MRGRRVDYHLINADNFKGFLDQVAQKTKVLTMDSP